MSRELINHSADLKRLLDEGYDIEIRDDFLLINHVPYVNSAKEIKYGVLVSNLAIAGDKTTKPDTHVAYFIGAQPCDKNGNVIEGLRHSSKDERLTNNLLVNRSFSQKPAGGYPDYYEKMTSYVNIIITPAHSVDESVSAKTFEIAVSDDSESVFKYIDTNSIRAKINLTSLKLKEQKIAIIGLGGTGSYILDLVAKTHVEEIHLYDGDKFINHNAMRAPGAPSVDLLREIWNKTDYFCEIYSNMRRNIFSHNYYITHSNIEELSGMNFVFLSFDNGVIKKLIVEHLEKSKIPFIDVGMGVEKTDDDKLLGVIRVTTSTENNRLHVHKRISFADDNDDDYSTNIQIAELNSLNAALAVIKWKKLCGFYQDLEKENHCTYSINVNMLVSDDHES